jgi:DNA polymerase-3 subunit epsilon
MMRYEDCLFLDTETTGLKFYDQIIEIAIVDYTGKVLFNSLVRPVAPTARVSDSAYRTHGICIEDLKDATTWPEIHEQIKAVIGTKCVVAFGASFDRSMIKGTLITCGLNGEMEWVDSIEFKCAQRFCGEALGYNIKRMSLKVAAERAGVPDNYEYRRALTSAQEMLSIVKVIVEDRIPPRIPVKRHRRLDHEYDDECY